MLKIISTYTLTQYINKGEYGKVYKAINHDTQQHVAIKMISLQKFVNNPKLIQLTKQQTQILTIVENNPNIIKLKQIIKSNKYLYMVYQYCQGGTLEQYLRKHGKITETQAIIIFGQLINAYQSLFNNNIVHRDIKTQNIFFKNDMVLKLADFGFSKRLKYQDDLMQTSLGSPLYMAPQVLNNDVYGSKADLWSCGVILYQMLFGRMPYGQTCNIAQLLRKYEEKSQLQFPQLYQLQTISPQILTMLRRMLTKDQFRRISWQQFLYEYQFSIQGRVIHKQRDFEYDLMKLMRRNSSQNNQMKQSINVVGNRSKVVRFDWSKVTDMNSSVHSQDCQRQQQQSHKQKYIQSHQQLMNKNSVSNIQCYSNKQFHSSKLINSHSTHFNQSSFASQQLIIPQNQNNEIDKHISQIYNIKKTIKHFQNQHTKILQVLMILEQLLQSSTNNNNNNSNSNNLSQLKVAYILINNIGELLAMNINSIQQYVQNNNKILVNLNEQRQKLQRLLRIFTTQLMNNNEKINQIKIMLLTVDNMGIGLEVFKYNSKNSLNSLNNNSNKKMSILRGVMREYVQNYQLQNDTVLDLIIENKCNNNKDNAHNVSRAQRLRLLRILWASQITTLNNNSNNIQSTTINKNTHTNRFNPTTLLSIKQQTTIEQISQLTNLFLVNIAI